MAKHLGNGGQLTQRQIETLQDYFTPQELALISNSLREKQRGDFEVAQAGAGGNVTLAETLMDQAKMASSLADVFDSVLW